MENQEAIDKLHFAQDGTLLADEPLDHFEFFGLTRQLNLDDAKLEIAYFELSRRLHPDFFVAKPPSQQMRSLEKTAALNNAYRALRDPIARAEYLVELETGAPFGESGEHGQVPTDLLEDVLEIRERMVDLATADDNDRETLAAAVWADRNWAVSRMKESDECLLVITTKWDDAGVTVSVNGARSALIGELKSQLSRRRYFSGLIREIDKLV